MLDIGKQTDSSGNRFPNFLQAGRRLQLATPTALCPLSLFELLYIGELILHFRFPEGGPVPEPEDGDGEPRRGVRRLGGGGVHVVALQPTGRHPIQDLRQRQPQPRASGGADANGE